MIPATKFNLPQQFEDLAQGFWRTMHQLLWHKPSTPLRCCFSGNFTTDKTTHFLFEDISPASLQEFANDAHLLAASIDADFVMTVLDMPGFRRSVSVCIETRKVTYVGTFAVIRKRGSKSKLTLGAGEFKKCTTFSEPFDRLLTARS